MMNLSRGLRVVALLLVAAFLLVGCGEIKPVEPSEEDLVVVMQADDVPICYDEMRYYTRNLKDQMAVYYGDIWANADAAAPYVQELTDSVMSMARYNAAVLSLCAEFGISIDEEKIQEGVQAEVEALVEELGSFSKYKEALASYYMTDRLFRYITGVTLCENELFYAMLDLDIINESDEAVQAYFATDDFIRTLHIFISNDEGESVDANRKRAEEALQKLNEGAKFTTTIGNYSEDFYMTTTDGYYFSRGEMKQVYEDAAFALEENTYSDVIETEEGFYIIQRLPKDNAYIEKNFDDLKIQYLSTLFNREIDARRDEIKVTFTQAGSAISLWEIE
ncbi:MAG: peptidylprolyl isomerase [Clostridia bacterium]|nr:peptidylprolyl isomerase [Clostridia bacterium]